VNRVTIVAIPHNDRMTVDPEGSEKDLGPFVALPIPMPRNAMVWTGHDGKPLVLWCDRQRIHPRDFATVLTGIRQFNDDLASGAVPTLPREVMEAIVRDELDEDNED
jgi:hypothetical protein